MSTLPGQASKGEKTKPKFQSLDINSLYRVSRGENLEKQQQKSSSVYIKHGMQILGKVPNARRAPANLPSLKSEYSGTDAAVPLVPPGAPGWGKQDSSNSGSSPSPNNNQTTQPQDLNASPLTVPNQQGVPPQLTSHQAAIALPVTNNIPPQTHKQLTPTAQPAPTDKLWSSVMSSPEVHPPLYQSVQFQHEFPSLSSGDGGPTRTGSDVPQYPTGLSLRPQTEGSWTQGGQRTLGPQGATGGDVAGQGRTGSGHLVAPPQLSAQAGHQPQQQPFPPQIRGVMPSFMYKGSNFQQAPGIGIQNSTMPPSVNGRGARPTDNRPPRLADRETEEIASRPIIREEELSRMDEISKDMGWAESDEIDYNQKLAFSDDESEKTSKRDTKRSQPKDTRADDRESHNDQNRQSGNSRLGPQRGRNSEEEDIWVQRRTQQEKEVEIAVQRAKQRKEEEEKRFNEERKLAAAKKLMELEEKIQKRDRDNHEGVGTINPNSVPPKPINHVDIPLPDFQKDKERDMHREKGTRSRTPIDLSEEKSQPANQGSSFRQLTQIEGKNFPPRKQHTKPSERDNRDNREQNGPNFSRQFQNDLPPRFLKHQRNNSNSNLQNQQQQYHQQSFDNRWNSNSGTKPTNQNTLHNRNVRQDSPELEKEDVERKEYKRQSSDDSYRNSLHSQDLGQRESQDSRYHSDAPDNRHQDYEVQYSRRDQEQDKWQKEKDVQDKKLESEHSHRLSKDDWSGRSEKVDKGSEKYEIDRDRAQRLENRDSRDSRSTRHSRETDQRDYNMGSWSESMYESSYEDKRKDYGREERRAVPGPITKDRIEADDMYNEKRNLIQLKRGGFILEIKKEPLPKKDTEFVSAWADSIPPALEEAQAKLTEDKKTPEPSKVETKHPEQQSKKSEKVDDYNQNRNRSYGQKKGWNNSGDGHPSRGPAWPRRPPSRGHKSGGRNHDYPTTDSDGSLEDHSGKKDETKIDTSKSEQIDQRSPKPMRKSERDDKNRDIKSHNNDPKRQDKSERKDNNYVPRGEPSRHGRGGGNFRSGRMGGLGKRIDGYGPPPTKSPFGGHQDEKEKDKKHEETPSTEHTPRVEDKIKQNQQALAAGIIGKRSESRNEPSSGSEDRPRDKPRNKSANRKNKPKLDEKLETNTDISEDKNRDSRKSQQKSQGNRPSSNSNRARNNPPRMGGEKRYEGNRENTRQNSNNSLKKEEKSTDHNPLSNANADISTKNREESEQVDEKEKSSVNGDAEGFQEVKSKKTFKERQKSFDDKTSKPSKPENGKEVRVERDRERDRKKISPATQQLTQQQIQNIPSLMATPVNPPPVLPQLKSQFDRPRQPKLPPRFAKQKLQKQQQQQQQHHGLGDVNDMNKVNQNMNVYAMKDTTSVPPSVPTCAWDKPLVSQLRTVEHDTMLGVNIDGVKGLESTHSPTQGVSPGGEKVIGKTGQIQEKTLLDGATPPVNTIIFENTNFKSAPGSRQVRNDKPRSKLEEGANIDPSVMNSFNKPNMNELLQTKTEKSEAIQLPPYKEEIADMKLDFFSADYQFADDKSTKNFVTKSIHAITSGNNTVDSLDIKIASVKKVWETSEQEGEDNTQMSFGGPTLDSNVFNQGKDTPDDNHEGYSPSPNQSAATTNVCKVKPTQQVSGSGQTVLSSSHQPHSGIVAPSLMGNPLSPPPLQPVLGAGVGIGPQYTANQHIGYQAGLSGSTQYGISAIPSPPTVPLVYNTSTQQIQAAAAQTGLYGAFQLDQLGGQGRSQFSQYPNYHSLGQTANSPYSTQSVYLPTAAPPPHPPPPTAPGPPELYQNMSNYRLSATAAFGQTQPINNPTTVLISSTSNTLMSASVKPSSQPISAIGTKTGGVGQAYQQQSQQSQQVFMAYDPSIQANYLASSAGVMQRTPVPPAQNNVVPGLQPSSSYYSGSTGGQTGYFQQPGSSTMNSAQLQQHQTGYGLQGNVFGTHNQSHTNTGMQNYNSHFLTTPMQVAAALSAQQFRSSLPAAYMKGMGNQGLGDQATRPQQLKSPSSQEVLSSVFNTGPQIPSPKSRQNSKHPPPQSSPTAQHKYNLYQQVGGQQNPNLQRYPTPIQRPVNFQQIQQNNSVNQKHRNNSNKTINRQYYGNQNQTEKSDEVKITENVTLNNNSTGSGKSLGTNNGNSVTVTTEKVKDTIKEESAVLKD
ncbi:uncharacterized protein LOC130448914 [Diorhabda sublineata]|uniref:uncharacterized protein LOC130448914 n=1 Tax=Diorhabda sublineata TaxID=1163346 RepID=UPI0024E12311|nr:uncharacterized protein LOC130448914 [Diorhabda sublineata]